jgi:3-oxosteroid 1-dehydrogenase
VLTFGTGIVAPFFKAALDREVPILNDHRVVSLDRLDSGSLRLTIDTPTGSTTLTTQHLVIATGAHDWSQAYMDEFTGIPEADGGSVVTDSVRGDGLDLALSLGAGRATLPPWAAPVLPGYRLPEPAFEGDSGFRACFEHCLPHTVIVDAAGERFCDDSFHSKIVSEVLGDGSSPARFPIHMVWDSQHHLKYGLGATAPGGEYPEGLVVSAETVEELAEALGISPVGLRTTVETYNRGAAHGIDEAFDRGSNLSVRRFRGDGNQEPNPCVGPITQGPFFGMRLRLLSTGIAAAGVTTGALGRLTTSEGDVIHGVHVIGETAGRAAAGVGYNSGYSLSRAMAYGFLAAHDIASTHS